MNGTLETLEMCFELKPKLTLVRANIFALFTALFAGPPLTIFPDYLVSFPNHFRLGTRLLDLPKEL